MPEAPGRDRDGLGLGLAGDERCRRGVGGVRGGVRGRCGLGAPDARRDDRLRTDGRTSAVCAVIIAGAGGAAHLPGMLAAVTPLPVIGVPVPLKYLDGMDSLLSIVQMPAGVPVATVAIGNARNAGLLAVRILAAGDPALRQQMIDFQDQLRRSAEAKGAAVREAPSPAQHAATRRRRCRARAAQQQRAAGSDRQAGQPGPDRTMPTFGAGRGGAHVSGRATRGAGSTVPASFAGELIGIPALREDRAEQPALSLRRDSVRCQRSGRAKGSPRPGRVDTGLHPDAVGGGRVDAVDPPDRTCRGSARSSDSVRRVGVRDRAGRSSQPTAVVGIDRVDQPLVVRTGCGRAPRPVPRSG